MNGIADAATRQSAANGASGYPQAAEAAPAAGPAAPPPAAGKEARGPKVVLRQEVATKLQARILTWSVIILNCVFVLIALALFGLHSRADVSASEVRRTYWGRLGIAIACMGALLFTAAWFVQSVRKSKQEGRVWTHRQNYFAWTAGGLMFLQVTYVAFILGSIASTLAQPDCGYDWETLTVLQFFQWTFFSASLFFLLARLKNMVLWRGEGALDMHPDYRLLVDRPYRDQARAHLVVLTVWLMLEVAALVGMITRLDKITGSAIISQPGCELNLKTITCGHSTTQIVTACISFLLIIVMVFIWMHLVRRALRDHEMLPFIHYRATHMYIRVQARVITTVFTAVVMSLLFMSIIPAFQGSCVATADAQVGNVAVCMSVTVAAVVLAILYMPKAQALDSPLLQEFLQDFSWTQSGIPAAIEARNQRLQDSEAASIAVKVSAESAITNVLVFLLGKAMAGLAKMTGVQDMRSAVEQLRKEPIFCMETAIRLFYWARLAYRQEERLDHEFVNAAAALHLFDLEQHVTVWDDQTDTHCVLGWSGSRVVMAFRGTASLQNAMTDIKAWKVTLKPERRVHGLLVKAMIGYHNSHCSCCIVAHAGFATAWLNDGFNKKVLAKLQQIDQARRGSEPLRFWITGHSLGGALAILASVEVCKAFPDSQMTCYTWGAPRVGNAAFTAEQEEAVPDTWAILNGLDPIPWIPKVGFKRAGKRVTINPKGDLILRPTYFEVSVMQRGTNAKHHMTGSYALSIAAVLKSQFVASKAFHGGAAGVQQLAAALDLGEVLVLKHMDLAELESPEPLPSPLDDAGSRKTLDSHKGGLLDECDNSCSGRGCWMWSKQGGVPDEEVCESGMLEADMAEMQGAG